jgi:hypothetical protein
LRGMAARRPTRITAPVPSLEVEFLKPLRTKTKSPLRIVVRLRFAESSRSALVME